MKKRIFVVPVYFKVKAEDYAAAETAVDLAVRYGTVETTHNIPAKEVKDWSLYPDAVQVKHNAQSNSNKTGGWVG